jgi:GT2 family glycosyltransferase
MGGYGIEGWRAPLVSVVIVNFNGGELVKQAVSIVLRSDLLLEVFVSDNGSTDESLTALQAVAKSDLRLHIIDNRKNLGFSRANNIAIKKATGDFLLLLNPDCLMRPDTLRCMLGVMSEHPDIGMAGCLIRNADGSEQAGCRRAIPTPWRTLVRVLHLNKLFPSHRRFRTFLLNFDPIPATPIEVEAISGAFMLVRRKALEQVGLLDEGYFLHCDDLDWCMRFRQADWKILYVPDAEAVHYKGTCSKDRPIRVLFHMHRGMVRFYRKFFKHQYPLPLMGIVMMAVWLRFCLMAGWQLCKCFRKLKHKPVVLEMPLMNHDKATDQRVIEPGFRYLSPERRGEAHRVTSSSIQAR